VAVLLHDRMKPEEESEETNLRLDMPWSPSCFCW
jgi:hypothetical protein